MKKVFGWAIVALILGLMAVMLASRAEHRTGLGLGAAVAMMVVLLTLAAMGKRRAARDPEYAAKLAAAMAKAKAEGSPLQTWRRRRMQFLKILVPMLLLSLPIWYWLQAIQPDTPMLQDWRSADIQRLALAGGLILTLIGYGLRWLVRRGDSGL